VVFGSPSGPTETSLNRWFANVYIRFEGCDRCQDVASGQGSLVVAQGVGRVHFQVGLQ